MFDYVHRLFDQATRSFDVESYDAVCLLCRATVEAACYLYLTRKKQRIDGKIFGTLSDPPRRLDGSVRRIPFPELQSGIKKKKVLSEEQLKDLERIKEHGDLIAHLAEVTDRNIWRSVAKNPDKNPFDAIPKIGEVEASKDLEDTISIIRTVTYAALKDFAP
jgi:hypothetical protein